MGHSPSSPIILTLAVAVFALASLPITAKADSFFFGISGGDRHRHSSRHYGHRHHGHHHYRHHYRPHYWSGYHHYYRPPVVVAPPVVYHAPPPVVYSAPPVVSAVPSSPVYQAANGQYCREYQGTVTVNGVSQPSYGTACLMPDGAWRVVN